MSDDQAIVLVAPELLRAALHLPKTVDIYNVGWDHKRGAIQLAIEAEDLPGTLLTATFTEETDPTAEARVVRFQGWEKVE